MLQVGADVFVIRPLERGRWIFLRFSINPKVVTMRFPYAGLADTQAGQRLNFSSTRMRVCDRNAVLGWGSAFSNGPRTA